MSGNRDDFKGTITSAPHDIVKISILQRMQDCLDSIQRYYQMSFAGGASPSHVMQGHIVALFFYIEPAMRRSQSSDYQVVSGLVWSNDGADVIKAFRLMSRWLDDVHLTRIDTRQKIDTTNPETENQAKGL